MVSQMLELENNTRYISHIYSNGERERDRERENESARVYIIYLEIQYNEALKAQINQ